MTQSFNQDVYMTGKPCFGLDTNQYFKLAQFLRAVPSVSGRKTYRTMKAIRRAYF